MHRGLHQLLVLFLFLPLLAQAETRVFTEFVYDASGNVIGIQSDVSVAPPIVANISPSLVRIGETFSLVATGSDLRGVTVTPQDGNVRISNVATTTDQVTFDVLAGNDTPLGDYPLMFSTPLGTVLANISIEIRQPSLIIAPSPLAISPGTSQILDIRLTTRDVFDNTLSFAVANSSLISIAPDTVSIPLGATVPDQTVTVTALAEGNTSIAIDVSNLTTPAIPVFITGEFVPRQGGNQFFAPNLGVEIEVPDVPELVEIGPFAARPLGIQLGDGSQPQQNTITPIITNNLGIAAGNIATSVSPDEMAVGSGPIDIIVSGVGLDTVTGVNITPADDITLGTFTVAADGQTLTMPATIADTAAEGLRQIALTTVDGFIPFAGSNTDRINIAVNLPVIESINPIVVVRNTDSLAVTVRGQHLDNVETINILPATGMVGSNPQVLLNGAMLTFDLSVPTNEPLGQRVLTITTDAGTSTDVASSANSFEVVNGPVETLTPIIAPTLGIEIASDNQTSSDLEIRSNNLGVSLGDVITGLTPDQGRTGTELTLTINGSGLQSVAGIIITPDTGITTGTLTANAQGTQATIDVTIVADAPETLRRIDLVNADLVSLIPAVSSSANRFLVVGNQPAVTAITPNFVIRDAAPVLVTVVGDFLDGATAVSVQPPQGVSVSAPVVAADGRSLTVNISARADAPLGQRVVVVSTPAGDTSAIASAANSLTIANTISAQVTPVIAPVLGVQLQADAGTQPTIDRLITSAQLGIDMEIIPEPNTRTFSNLGFTQLGMVLGDSATSILPSAVALNSTVTLTINGTGLTDVTSVSLNPGDGITVSAPPTINADGTQLTVDLNIASDALIGARQVVLNTTDSTIAFANSAQSQLNVVTAMPQIDSITPIQAIAGSTVELIIRGINLDGTNAVAATPPNDITFATSPFVNSAGTEVTIQMNIATGATAGSRVITIITPVGASDSTASSANTFTIVTN